MPDAVTASLTRRLAPAMSAWLRRRTSAATGSLEGETFAFDPCDPLGMDAAQHRLPAPPRDGEARHRR